jgi:hypothetical protein
VPLGDGGMAGISHRCNYPWCKDPPCEAMWQRFYEAETNPAVREAAKRIILDGTDEELRALMADPFYCDMMTYDESDYLIRQRTHELKIDGIPFASDDWPKCTKCPEKAGFFYGREHYCPEHWDPIKKAPR